MKSLGQGFQKLEHHEQDSKTDTHTHIPTQKYNGMQFHSGTVIRSFFGDLFCAAILSVGQRKHFN